ncbi:gamma-glutamyltransferase family protein [Clostridium sp. 'deep sea']|uniref:gamma-glutamyltransferase family protein n=1 Tax=Clostridium sp. 'deep sea' TaxID=2779445 RepID=UPI00189662E3|nr:gamma-glutamyltransferase family protein [Clostridium sp. 'deep sea']QOR34347.1 gamma-glutamyltransferase family protein [Clostridium sp. 'deep sea']
MLKNDSLYYPYPARRRAVFARNGMVATSQPLAAQAGLDILKRGGNAIDAAVATAACLTVLEPTSNGIGGDGFALVWTKGKLHGLNSSGPAPKSISIEAVKALGYEEMPTYGFIPVTVPGIPAAWAELNNKFGKLPLSEVLQPAIEYAKNGYPVSPVASYYWNRAYHNFKQKTEGTQFDEWFKIFAPHNKTPKAGEMWSSPDHARTLELIGKTNAKAFYQGELAEKIAAFSKAYNAFISYDDLASFKPEWVDPIGVDYHGYKVWEIPPNGQGLVALLALNIAKELKMDGRDDVETLHNQIEAIKLAFADGQKYITEHKDMRFTTDQLLSETYANKRRALIKDTALKPEAGEPKSGGTVYLCAADNDGNMISYIQSNYMGFGSGLVVPGTGIALQNRGKNFSLDPNHDNHLAPNKRTYHTIIPGFLTKGDLPVGPFGVMGGFMQPQGHMQVVMNAIDFNLNPQAALDAPRWRWDKGMEVSMEMGFPQHIINALIRKGHKIKVQPNTGGFGRGQIIWRDPESGVLVGGTESRTDGTVAAW